MTLSSDLFQKLVVSHYLREITVRATKMRPWALSCFTAKFTFLKKKRHLTENTIITKNVNSSIFHKAIFSRKLIFLSMTPERVSLCYDFRLVGLLRCCSLELHVWFLVSCRAILTWRKQGASRETIKIPSKAQFWRPRSDLHCSHSILSMSDWTREAKPKVTRSDHKNRPSWEDLLRYSSVKTLMKMHLKASKNRDGRFAKESLQLKNHRKIGSIGTFLRFAVRCDLLQNRVLITFFQVDGGA